MNSMIRNIQLPRGRDYDPFKRNSECTFNREDQEYIAELQQDAIDREFSEHVEIEQLIEALDRE